jgi:hypothetical protein
MDLALTWALPIIFDKYERELLKGWVLKMNLGLTAQVLVLKLKNKLLRRFMVLD